KGPPLPYREEGLMTFESGEFDRPRPSATGGLPALGAWPRRARTGSRAVGLTPVLDDPVGRESEGEGRSMQAMTRCSRPAGHAGRRSANVSRSDLNKATSR